MGAFPFERVFLLPAAVFLDFKLKKRLLCLENAFFLPPHPWAVSPGLDAVMPPQALRKQKKSIGARPQPAEI
eukprot:scaffold3818_cov155-Ochromonas_danica.AAC.10